MPCHRELDLANVQLDDRFWSPRVEQIRTRTISLQHKLLRDTGRLDALRLGWVPGDEPVPHIFWDSDVAKWIEAASHALATRADAELEHQVDEAIDLLAGAQQPDGYLNTYFTVVEPARRFTDLRDAHELYCAGHLIEAGVAHFEATSKRTLLDVVRRFADLIGDVFGTGPGQRRGYDGHEEVELALVRLARATGERRYLELAAYFVDERGREPYFFDGEAAARKSPGYFGSHFSWREEDPQAFREYNQSHLPVRDQTEVVGHAVRAMYLYSGMADLAGDLPDASLERASQRLWQHLTSTRMYLTGGIGSTGTIEGFTRDYDLPNHDAYAETCASIGLVLWAHRMALLDRDRRYTDVLERALYNGVLSGIALDGGRFFYENPLASRGDVHRQEWFGVACCPPNLARLMTSLGRYVYSRSDDELAVHLFVSGRVTIELTDGTPVTVSQETDYPWQGETRLRVELPQPTSFALAVRVPGWCADPRLTVVGQPADTQRLLDRGYVRIAREWSDGDEVVLDLPMQVQRVYSHPAVSADVGRVALARGPLVYCFESVDNADSADNSSGLEALALPADGTLTAAWDGATLGGVVRVRSDAERPAVDGGGEALYGTRRPASARATATAIPYYAWDNRAPGEMAVWLRES